MKDLKRKKLINSVGSFDIVEIYCKKSSNHLVQLPIVRRHGYKLEAEQVI
jgi:hypothetical protein